MKRFFAPFLYASVLKKRFALLIFILHSSFFALTSFAQVCFGYLSYDSVLHQMPDYVQAQQSVSDLKGKFDKEATRGEEEFQKKFSEFLQGQKDFPENILVKRQAELQTLMETGISFRREARQLLSKAQRDLVANVEAKLNEAIRAVGEERGYDYIVNTDCNACPYINPARGEDITEAVLIQLGLKEPPTEEAEEREVLAVQAETN